MFSPSYSYSSSTVPGLVRHFEAYAREVEWPSGESPKRLLEIGCNDGVFLEPLANHGYDVVGIDACSNVVGLARARGLNVHLGSFGQKAARTLKDEHGWFDIVTCSNVFAHNPDLHDFIAGILALLEPGQGELWIEVHSALRLYEGIQWDCFYHEHCFYWSIHSLRRCLEAQGLFLKSYKVTPMHGGALRAVFSRTRTTLNVMEPELTSTDWKAFANNCRRSRDAIRAALDNLPVRYAYGAAGRAVTLINWTNISDRLEYVVDGSPLRYGNVVPNTTVPIISEKAFSERKDVNEWCFVTAHNYLSDIRAKVESFFPGRTVKYVTPLPHVSIQ